MLHKIANVWIDEGACMCNQACLEQDSIVFVDAGYVTAIAPDAVKHFESRRIEIITFWIGAALPCVTGSIVAVIEMVSMVYWRLLGNDPLPNVAEAVTPIRSLLIGLLVVWCIAPLSGLLCVFVHWLIWPESRP